MLFWKGEDKKNHQRPNSEVGQIIAQKYDVWWIKYSSNPELLAQIQRDNLINKLLTRINQQIDDGFGRTVLKLEVSQLKQKILEDQLSLLTED